MRETEIIISRMAVSTLPKIDVNPAVQRVVERALGRHVRAVLGIETQRLVGLHDDELTPSGRRLLFATALDLEVRAALREAVSGDSDA
jgi:hypothetical protein